MKITVAKRNGLEEVHAAGCRDLKNKRGRGWDSDRADYSLEVETLADLYREYWQCIDVENVGEGHYATVEDVWWAWRGEFKVLPCVGDLPEMDEPGVELPCPHEAKDGRICIGVKNHDGRHVLRAKPAPAPAPAKRKRGHRQFATKAVSPTMKAYTEWIAREFPEVGPVDERLVMIASKCYRAFQDSDFKV
jgi:hypothetical protein